MLKFDNYFSALFFPSYCRQKPFQAPFVLDVATGFALVNGMLVSVIEALYVLMWLWVGSRSPVIDHKKNIPWVQKSVSLRGTEQFSLFQKELEKN